MLLLFLVELTGIQGHFTYLPLFDLVIADHHFKLTTVMWQIDPEFLSTLSEIHVRGSQREADNKILFIKHNYLRGAWDQNFLVFHFNGTDWVGNSLVPRGSRFSQSWTLLWAVTSPRQTHWECPPNIARSNMAAFAARLRQLQQVAVAGLESKKIFRSPFGNQLEKYSRQMQIFSHQFV